MSDNWWESDPVVSSPTADAWWANDPIAEQKKEEEKKQTLIGMLSKWIGAPLDTAATLASGAVAPIAAGWAGIAGATLPGPEGQGAQWTKAVQDALTHHPETGMASWVENAVGGAMDYTFGRPARVAGATAESLGAPPWASTAAQTAIEGIPAFLPAIAKAAKYKGPYEPGLTTKEAQAVAAKDAGFSLPPNEVNPTLLARALTWASGEKNLGRAFAAKNQPLEQAAFRDQLGMAEGEPLTRDAYTGIVREAGKKFEAVRKTGASAVDGEYIKDLIDFKAPLIKQANAYPNGPAPAILKDVNSLMEPVIDADAAVSKIRELRNDANKAYRTGDSILGRQFKDLATIVEDELARHLERTGQPESVINDFRDARKTIAQAYTAQKFTAPSGEVKASALANELIRANGAPLEGGMLDVAQLGANFPSATKLPSRVGEVNPTLMDSAAGYLGHAAMGGHGGLLGLLAGTVGRPAVAKFTAGPYQRFVNPRSYDTPISDRAMSMAEQPTLGSNLSALGLESEDEKRRKMLAQILGGY